MPFKDVTATILDLVFIAEFMGSAVSYLWRQANKNWEFSGKQSCICVPIPFKLFGKSKRFNFLGKALI
jgi:hypothetical protein